MCGLTISRRPLGPASPKTSPPGALIVLRRAIAFNVRRVLWAAEALGLAFPREDYGRGFLPTDRAEFLALNPAGQVPVVIDGDVVLRESNAIVRYLAARERAECFYPSDLVRRQVIEQWMDWVAYDVTPALRGAFMGGQLREPP